MDSSDGGTEGRRDGAHFPQPACSPPAAPSQTRREMEENESSPKGEMTREQLCVSSMVARAPHVNRIGSAPSFLLKLTQFKSAAVTFMCKCTDSTTGVGQTRLAVIPSSRLGSASSVWSLLPSLTFRQHVDDLFKRERRLVFLSLFPFHRL